MANSGPQQPSPEQLRVAFEQMEAMIRDMVPMFATMWKNLVKEGVKEGPAAVMVGTFMAQSLKQ